MFDYRCIGWANIQASSYEYLLGGYVVRRQGQARCKINDEITNKGATFATGMLHSGWWASNKTRHKILYNRVLRQQKVRAVLGETFAVSDVFEIPPRKVRVVVADQKRQFELNKDYAIEQCPEWHGRKENRWLSFMIALMQHVVVKVVYDLRNAFCLPKSRPRWSEDVLKEWMMK